MLAAETSRSDEEQDSYLVSKYLPSSYLLTTKGKVVDKFAFHNFDQLIFHQRYWDKNNVRGLWRKHIGTDQHHFWEIPAWNVYLESNHEEMDRSPLRDILQNN